MALSNMLFVWCASFRATPEVVSVSQEESDPAQRPRQCWQLVLHACCILTVTSMQGVWSLYDLLIWSHETCPKIIMQINAVWQLVRLEFMFEL